jgi:hypothetical protein
MFKQRVKDWDLHKNYKAAERKELAQIITVVKYHEVMGETQPRKVLLRGQPVKMHKLRRDIRSQNLSTRRLLELRDLAQGIKSMPGQEVSVEDLRKRLVRSSSPASPLTTPPQLKNTELFLLYTDIFYKSVTVDSFPPVVDYAAIPPSRDYCNKVDAAFEVLKSGKSAKALQLLNDASEVTKQMLEKRCTETLSNFVYNAADWANDCPPDVFRVFWNYLTAMATIVLGEEHPTAMICKTIGDLEPGSSMYATAFQLIIKRLEKLLGHGHPETLASKDRYNVLLCWSGNFSEAERLHRQIVDYYDACDRLSHNAISCAYRLGRIMVRGGNFRGAEIVYRDTVERRKVSNHCANCPSYIHIAVVTDLVDCLLRRNEYAESEEILEDALGGFLKLDMKETVRIVSKLDSVLVKLGKDEKAEMLRLKYPEAF